MDVIYIVAHCYHSKFDLQTGGRYCDQCSTTILPSEYKARIRKLRKSQVGLV
jgi:nitrite reductase/ring-hydroxylating ferredoxin subunit